MNIFKIIGGISATILLGAIGSGLWERFLSPFVDYIKYKVVQTISVFYTGYLDSIYQRASEQLSGTYIYGSNTMIIYLMAITIITITLFTGKVFKDIKLTDRFVGFLTGGALLVLSFFSGATNYYNKEIRSYSYRSIEILRPYIY